MDLEIKFLLRLHSQRVDVMGASPRFLYFLTFDFKISLNLQRNCKSSVECSHAASHSFS